MTPYRTSKWGPQILLEKVGSVEFWETIPKYNHYGGVRRQVGETFQQDGVTYTVMEVTPSAALCKQTAAKIVKYIADDGEEKERMVWGSSTIRVAPYRERNKSVE